MNPVIWGFIGAIVGAIVGAAASIGTTVITTRNEQKLQSFIEKNSRFDLHMGFQRDNLLKLQDILSDCVRLVSKAHLEDLDNFIKGSKWGELVLSCELDEGIRVRFRELRIIIERISNDQLRQDLKDFEDMMEASVIVKTKEGAEILLMDIANSFKNLMTVVGLELRKTYQSN